MYKSILFLTALFAQFTLKAQQTPEMAFDLRSSGKIYVVVAVLAVIFVGIAVFLFWVDLKVKRLEKESNNKSK
jgi:CcmD family protein